jgi:hypothetical protein
MTPTNVMVTQYNLYVWSKVTMTCHWSTQQNISCRPAYHFLLSSQQNALLRQFTNVCQHTTAGTFRNIAPFACWYEVTSTEQHNYRLHCDQSRHTQTHTGRHRHTQTDTDTQTNRHIQTDTDTQTYTDRHTDIQTDTQIVRHDEVKINFSSFARSSVTVRRHNVYSYI